MVATNAIAYDSLNYDAAGRMVRSFQKINGKTWQWNYTYDIHNRLTQRVDAAGQHKVYLGWSSGGGLSSVSATGEGMQFERVAAESLSVRRVYGNVGNTWSARRTITKAHSDSTVDYPERTALNAAFGVAFVFDALNRLRNQKYNSSYNRSFSYDAAGRLIESCDSTPFGCKDEWGSVGYGYTYDAAGNRLLGGEPLTNIDPGNRVNSTHGWNLGYDANGNLEFKCRPPYCVSGFHYTWDALGRLDNITTMTMGFVDSMGYDAFGRRVQRTTTSGTEWYVYDGQHIAFDLNNSNTIKNEYGYYPGTDALYTLKNSSWTGIALTDPRIGSIIGWADTLGNMKKKYDIKAWGRVTGDTGVITRHRMAGREYDQESGLYYMRARYYDPETGRFLSEDPIGIAGGLNLYAYSGNDPVNNRDPSGTDFYCYRIYSYIVTYVGFGDVSSIHESGVSGPICSGSISLPSVGGPSGGMSGGGGKHSGGPSGSGQADPCKGKQYTAGIVGSIGGGTGWLAGFLGASLSVGINSFGQLFFQVQGSLTGGTGMYVGYGYQPSVTFEADPLPMGFSSSTTAIAIVNVGTGPVSFGASVEGDGHSITAGATPAVRMGSGFGYQASGGAAQNLYFTLNSPSKPKCKS